MTDHHDSDAETPDDARDLLASRYVDGDLDEAERAAALADAEVVARIDALSSLRARLADTGPVDSAVTRAAVAAALAAADWLADAESEGVPAVSGVTASPQDVTSPVVVPFRRKRSMAALPWLGAAAAAALIVVGVASLDNGTGGDFADDASTADTMSAESATAGGDALGDAPLSPNDDQRDTDDSGAPRVEATSATEAPEMSGASTEYDTSADSMAPATEAPAENLPPATDGTTATGTDAPMATSVPDAGVDLAEPFPFPIDGQVLRLSDPEELRWFAVWAPVLEAETSACAPYTDVLATLALFGPTDETADQVEIIRETTTTTVSVVAYRLGDCSEAARSPI